MDIAMQKRRYYLAITPLLSGNINAFINVLRNKCLQEMIRFVGIGQKRDVRKIRYYSNLTESSSIECAAHSSFSLVGNDRVRLNC